MINRRNAVKLGISSLLLPIIGAKAVANKEESKWETRDIHYRRSDGITYIRIDSREFDCYSYDKDSSYWSKASYVSSYGLENRDYKAKIVNGKVKMVYCGRLGLESAKLSMIRDNEIAMVCDNNKVKTVYTYYHFGPERSQVITSDRPFHKIKYT